MPPKSIFRQPGAKHFQLVHRSQRDPLIHDSNASQHVLKPFERENTKKGKSRADLESILPSSELAQDGRTNVGEATLYGIYYDDTEYDYMQHLRQVGVQEEGVDSILIEAPPTSRTRSQIKKTSDIDLPQGVLASTLELPRTYESQQAIPESIAGFQPDMDPHLRQVLEALEDDAFVDDDLKDDFFEELVGDGERGTDEAVEFEFDEQDIEEPKEVISGPPTGENDRQEAGWEEQFAQFKQSQKAKGGSEDEYESEGGDTVGGLPHVSVIGGKKRRKGTSDASGYSMSSSSMYRNEALQTLDERFDQMIIKEYNEDAEENSVSSDGKSDSDEAPELITSRDDFESMMDEFLYDYEILGRKMKLKLAGESGTEKLDTLRRAMGQDERVRNDGGKNDEDDILMPLEAEDKQDRWDCETILTTYSNLENHPRLIRARDARSVPKIHFNPKTGLPTVFDQPKKSKPQIAQSRDLFYNPSEGSESESDSDSGSRPRTITRPRNESKEEKRARKAAVKAERQTRRADKKATKEQFGVELKVQTRAIGNKERRLKKL